MKPLLKVCGLTQCKDVQCCLDAGIDFTGFIFAAKSPRVVSPEQVLAMPRGKALRVGVFVGQPPEYVQQMLTQAELDFAQLHGDESIAFCKAIGPERVIKVLWPERYASLEELQQECQAYADACSYFLLDAGTSGGGHGKPMSWEVLRGFSTARPWLLAGGLTPENALQALHTSLASGLDFNSGLEDSPGNKNHEAIKRVAELFKA